jgi:probable phosphoglycerate mutase
MIQPASRKVAPMHADAPLRLVLIRHGETEWSRSGQHTGRTDIGLTENGRDEARALAPLLQGFRFDHVFVSPAARARATCNLAGCGADAAVEPDLAEWDYGAFEGRRSIDIRADWPDWLVYRDGAPGGESTRQISERADRLIGRLSILTGTVALFSHGQFGCCLACRWIDQPIAFAQHLLFGTGSAGILSTRPDNPNLRVIAQWNIRR